MTGHYENFSRLDSSFELWLKSTSAWAKATSEKYEQSTTIFSVTEKKQKKLAYRYSFGLSDEERPLARPTGWRKLVQVLLLYSF